MEDEPSNFRSTACVVHVSELNFVRFCSKKVPPECVKVHVVKAANLKVNVPDAPLKDASAPSCPSGRSGMSPTASYPAHAMVPSVHFSSIQRQNDN